MGDGAVKSKTMFPVWASLSVLNNVLAPPQTHAIGSEQCFDHARETKSMYGWFILSLHIKQCQKYFKDLKKDTKYNVVYKENSGGNRKNKGFAIFLHI